MEFIYYYKLCVQYKFGSFLSLQETLPHIIFITLRSLEVYGLLVLILSPLWSWLGVCWESAGSRLGIGRELAGRAGIGRVSHIGRKGQNCP